MSGPLAGAPTLVDTERLVLRPFRTADAEAFDALVAASVDHLAPWEPWAAEPPRPLAQQRADLADLGAQLAAGAASHYAVTLRCDGSLLGSAALVPGTHGAIEIGYWLGAAHVGRGYATEAVTALTRIGLTTLRLARIEAWADTANAASNAVVERSGYRRIGTKRSHWHQDNPPLMNVWVAERDTPEGAPVSSLPRPHRAD